MNALIAYTNTAQVVKLLEWTAELGGVQNHQLILMPFKGLDAAPVADMGKRAFKSVRVEPDYEGVTSNWSDQSKGQKDAAGPNSMFRQAAWAVYNQKLGQFFFWEPDAIPLAPEWLDRLEAEYKQAGKPFMGAYVPATATGVPAHLTGNAICPENTIELAPSMVLCKQLAFDVAGAAEILPRAHITKQIQHVFYHPDYPLVPTFPDQGSLKLVKADAVIFHRNKDLTLIDRLRERKRGDVTCRQESETGLVDAERSAKSNASASLDRLEGNAAPTFDPKAAAIPRVHCYFRPGHGEFLEEQKRLLAIWSREWTRAGFEPVVLTEAEAFKHPRFLEWSAALLKKPTINPPLFEGASWTRWIAMAANPGICTDYDVIPNGFVLIPPLVGPLPYLYCDCVPCAMVGTQRQYENAIEAFISCEPVIEQGRPHLSDMHACQKLNFPRVDRCREYFASGWKTAQLIHFPHRRCNPQARSAVIEAALKQLEAEQAEPVGPLHDAPEVETMASKRRKLIAELKLLSDTPSRKVLTYQELRKQGVIGQPKKRKKQRLVVM